MFGFIKSGNNISLGGEIFQERKRSKRIFLIILGILSFIVLNIILYYLTNV
ncbi:MAG: hypothetical protein NTX22_01455 [Ignavibacteriales bacterium]|nr:hypothetical protein [Ignavibacteriales bacterium]